MYLIEPTGRKRKYDIRLRNHDGRVVRIPGDRDAAVAKRIGERVEMLVKAKHNGHPPPGELASWIANMEEALGNSLVELGLLQPRHRARNTPLIDWVQPWGKVVSGRKPDSKLHACQQERKVRRIIASTKATRLEDLESDLVVEKNNEFKTKGCKQPTPISTTTRRHYGIAIKDFADWLARKMKVENPLADMPVPGTNENPEYERQPLTVAQFRLLMAYLDTFERYKGQKCRWNAYDRKMIYWTAVKTGYRQTEMKKLRRWNLYLDETPPSSA